MWLFDFPFFFAREFDFKVAKKETTGKPPSFSDPTLIAAFSNQ